MLPISVDIKTKFQLLLLTLFSSKNNFSPQTSVFPVTIYISNICGKVMQVKAASWHVIIIPVHLPLL